MGNHKAYVILADKKKKIASNFSFEYVDAPDVEDIRDKFTEHEAEMIVEFIFSQDDSMEDTFEDGRYFIAVVYEESEISRYVSQLDGYKWY